MNYKEYKINQHNSSVNGNAGRFYDWDKFCWDGSAIYIDKAYPAYIDGDENYQYLHVPYDWVEDCTVYRIYPNDCMRAGKVYRGHLIKKQTAVKKDDGWYWRLEW